MRILAIDTALEACAAAVLDTDTGKVASESQPMVRGHAEALMPLIGRVMRAAELAFSALDRVAVTIGPGSFTGLRVGISAARGIALATGKPAFGIATLSAYAAPLLADDDESTVVAAIDARHEHVYLSVFGPGGRLLVAPRIASVGEAVLAAEGERLRIIGTGAEMLAEAWPIGRRLPLRVENRRAPDIAWIARLATAMERSAGPPKPLYLRAPDAQPQDAARLPRR
jgi:tRNA threonylcarbamoyladenosine biosynthesis protein TsaB